MKPRKSPAFQVVYRRRKLIRRPDIRPHRASAVQPAGDISGLIFYGQA